MFSRKQRDEHSPGDSKSNPNAKGDPKRNPLAVRDVGGEEKPQRRDFPGPRGAQSPLRVAIDRGAHAELIAHAKESLEAEVCGVLAGQICEDDEGLFVHVQACIRGAKASQGSTHVTFTHATWDAIYQTLERDHPKLRIVGWYHTHPGFGVEFSEMDLFIQRNFFSSPTQIALVTDPLSGAVAICYNAPGGIAYLPRFWVDGREQECKTPAMPASSKAADGGSGALTEETARKLQDLEARVSQLVLAMDEQRTSLHRFLLFAGMLFCLGIISVAGYAIFLQLKARVEPPKNIGFAAVPVQIGEHAALLGVQVVSWQLPPELDVVEQLKREIEKQLALQLGSNIAFGGTNAPAGTNALKPTP